MGRCLFRTDVSPQSRLWPKFVIILLVRVSVNITFPSLLSDTWILPQLVETSLLVKHLDKHWMLPNNCKPKHCFKFLTKAGLLKMIIIYANLPFKMSCPLVFDVSVWTSKSVTSLGSFRTWTYRLSCCPGLTKEGACGQTLLHTLCA